ncbi:hypothetical protein KP509_12G046000 [Ceratopteris richardii]|uniref:Protein kinase domain-containing protein n=1 Tax=Ceratopteris richardii TaxID=49495 RepID=A0A8T2TIP7_CERRI|nr:hypothetical protein KP509_12G046000 [Ceratopteris richardii]
MDLELIFIGLFALFGCSFFIVFLMCFQKALQALDSEGEDCEKDDAGEELTCQTTVSYSADIDDTTFPITPRIVPADNPPMLSRSRTISTCQYPGNFQFMKRLSRSLTGERSAIIIPCIIRDFSIAEINAITAKSSTGNIIHRGHSGDIFNGMLEGGELVVVKRLAKPFGKSATDDCSRARGNGVDDMFTSHRHSDKDYYATEMDVYGKVLDRTFLVPLIGQCLASQEDRFLVYEYMSYRDLATMLARSRTVRTLSQRQQAKFLDEPDSEDDIVPTINLSSPAESTFSTTGRSSSTTAYSSFAYISVNQQSFGNANTVTRSVNAPGSSPGPVLTWPARIKVARCVAKALVYLHHHCRPPLCHRSIQASSILLDKGFEIKLGSLGDVHKMEYGEQPVYDIYCYGRLLLDLISGLNISGNGRTEADRAWMNMFFDTLNGIGTTIRSQPPAGSFIFKQLHVPVMFTSHLIDKNLLPFMHERHLLEIIQVAQVAKLCLEPTSLQKLTMKDVLHLLPPSN